MNLKKVIKNPVKKSSTIRNKNRTPTGIAGFDRLCKGGFIKDSINLVIGNAGSGKTTFLLQFLYNGASQFNESGLFVTFEQETHDLKRTGKKQNMDFGKLEKKGKIHFLKLNPDMSLKQIQKQLIKRITEYDIKRICFDPINIFSLEFPKETNVRKQLYDFLNILKQLDSCVLISGESDNENGSGQKINEEIVFCRYLTDSVIELFASGISGSGDRAIRIVKMRMTDHLRGPVGMQITNNGIKVLKN